MYKKIKSFKYCNVNTGIFFLHIAGTCTCRSLKEKLHKDKISIMSFYQVLVYFCEQLTTFSLNLTFFYRINCWNHLWSIYILLSLCRKCYIHVHAVVWNKHKQVHFVVSTCTCKLKAIQSLKFIFLLNIYIFIYLYKQILEKV